MVKPKNKKYKWNGIKGAHGYGHEITNEEGKRVAILDCQDSVWEEYSTGFSIVPKTKVHLRKNPDPHTENRFDDIDLEFNARLIRNAPKMYDLLWKVVNNLFEGESPKGSLQGDVYDALHDIEGRSV